MRLFTHPSPSDAYLLDTYLLSSIAFKFKWHRQWYSDSLGDGVHPRTLRMFYLSCATHTVCKKTMSFLLVRGFKFQRAFLGWDILSWSMFAPRLRLDPLTMDVCRCRMSLSNFSRTRSVRILFSSLSCCVAVASLWQLFFYGVVLKSSELREQL